MRVVASLILLLLVGGAIVGSIVLVAETRRRALVHRAPAGALTEPGDSTPIAQFKLRAYAKERKHVKLLEEVRRVDETMTFLPAQLRKEIDEAVEEFYEED